MKTVRRVLPWLALGLIGLLLWWKWPGADSTGSGETPVPPAAASGKSSETSAADAAFAKVRVNPGNAADQVINRLFEAFRAISRKQDSLRILNELRDSLRAMEPALAAAAVAGFLESGEDCPTQLPFVVGDQGMLQTAPTFRTALLDLLIALDPETALAISRSVMDRKSSPDEFALALRNLAWNDCNGDLKTELSDRFGQMIQTKDWLGDPSAGFLEALDIAVFLGGKQPFEAILLIHAEGARSANNELSRASFLALDRMVRTEPALLVASAGDLMEKLPADTRASLFSRLDLTIENQRETLVRYLSDPHVDQREIDYFSAIFPNGNFVHGHWLVTTNEPTATIRSRLEADRRALIEVEKLLGAEEGEKLNQALVRIKGRLQKLVGDAEGE